MGRGVGARAVAFLSERPHGADSATVAEALSEPIETVDQRLRVMSKGDDPRVGFVVSPDGSVTWVFVRSPKPGEDGYDGPVPTKRARATSDDAGERADDESHGPSVKRLGGRSKGWKPNVSALAPIVSPVAPGDMISVAYRENWRSTVIAKAIREPDEQGAVLAWDVNNSYHCFVPGTPACAERTGIDVRVVDARTLARLTALRKIEEEKP